MGVLDKVRKFKGNRPKNDGGKRTRGIFKDWKDGANPVRLIGEFLEVKTHFVAAAPARGDRGMCMSEAFDKDNKDRIAKVVNCPDWDIETEQETAKKTCPICKLYKLAAQALKEDPNDEEKKYFETLKSSARVRTNLKWNVFDRNDPNVTVVDEQGNEVKQKGIKIATIGMEAWDDIEGIFEQCSPLDITDAEEGVDINVIRGHNGTRTSYSAQVILQGKGLKVTPFDEEEQALVAALHNLKSICGKKTDATAILNGLHGDYRDMLELNPDEEEEDAPAPAAKAAPAARKKPAVSEEEDGGVDDDADDADDDALLGGSKKK